MASEIKGGGGDSTVIPILNSPANSEQPIEPQVKYAPSIISSNATTSAIKQILADSSHPVALIFHYLFRTLSLVIYLFIGWLGEIGFIFTFVMVILLSAADFWTVKNITGRLLVGLRWWNETKAEDGSNIWIFENKGSNYKANPVDHKMFWLALYVYPVIWIALSFISLMRHFEWLLLNAMVLGLLGSNLIGYIKCDKEAKKKIATSLGTSIMSGFIGTKINAILQ